MTTAYKIFVSHPERQHSHELAAALESANALGRYVYGGPLPRASQLAISGARREQLPFCRIWRRALRPFLPPRALLTSYYRSIWAFDALMAQRLRHIRCDAVVAYENAALNEFRVAKQLGMACILDNSGVHHTLQDRMLDRTLAPSVHARIVERKDEELALADIILVCSTFARDSFIDGGVPAHKIKVVPLGCEISSFAPPTLSEVASSPIRFLFVGHLSRLKGADLIAEAMRRLQANGSAFALMLVASLEEADPNILEAFSEGVEKLGKVPHERLAAIHAQADCLVLPSRFDSFGLVVAEALASGLPVIVSDHVGAKDLVSESENGWVIRSGSADELYERMLWCARHPNMVRAMRPAARATAEAWDWNQYRSRALRVIDDFMTPRRNSISYKDK